MKQAIQFGAVDKTNKKDNGFNLRAKEASQIPHLCYLPKIKSFFTSYGLKLFYSGIKDDPNQLMQIRDLPEDAVIIYVSSYRSNFEFLFYHTRYPKLDLPAPVIGMEYRFILWQPLTRVFRAIFARVSSWIRRKKFSDPYESGFMREELIDKQSAGYLSLISQRGFYRRFIKAKTDPIRYLIELQSKINKPVFLIPQLMFFGRSPERTLPPITDIFFGSEARPGNLRRIFTLFKKPEKVFVEVSTPLNLKEFLSLPEVASENVKKQTALVRQTLITQINRHRQSITGPMLKTPQELKESILTGDRMRQFMEHHSAMKSMTLQKVHREADGYLEEIAAKYSTGLVRFGEFVLKRLFNLMFEGINIDTEGLMRTKDMAKKGPLILIPCHKSHIDYLVLSYIFQINNMPCPHIAAGKNLSFWPLGPIFRRGGAFFIRRTFKGAVLYSKVFSEYVYKLLEEGFNIEIFIEGGRSRTGKLLMPKLGFLSILLNAFRNGACEDLILVPIFIGYDRVLEESAYLHELEGGEKEPENLLQVLRARRFLKKKKWGRIYLKFHDPISLSKILSERGTAIADLSIKEQNSLCRQTGYRVISAIDSIAIVTPHALVAAVLLNSLKNRISYAELHSHVETYLSYLSCREAILSDTLMMDPVRAVDQVIETYLNRDFIEKIEDKKETPLSKSEFSINENKRPSLEYYKNNCISFFIPAAITSAAILDTDAFQFSASDLHERYLFLQELFKNEFAYNLDTTAEFHIRKTIKAFIDEAILMPHPTLPDRYNLTAVGFRKLKRFAGFLLTFMESYRVVLTYFSLYPKDAMDPKHRLKKIESRGVRMYKRGDIGRSEALSNMNYKNAVDFFTGKGIIGAENQEKIDFYGQTLDRYISRLAG
jgi:glycerol-3-phosphate O-acyltransferase